MHGGSAKGVIKSNWYGLIFHNLWKTMLPLWNCMRMQLLPEPKSFTSHMINWTGNIVSAGPLRIWRTERGVKWLWMGHTFAHFRHLIPDTGADYLRPPFINGCVRRLVAVCYILKGKIKVSGPYCPAGNRIRKTSGNLKLLGTRSFASEMAIGTAVDFHNTIGIKRKKRSSVSWKEYWTEKLRCFQSVCLLHQLNQNIPAPLQILVLKDGPRIRWGNRLLEKYKIHTVSIVHEKVNGIRVTPSTYEHFRLDTL